MVNAAAETSHFLVQQLHVSSFPAVADDDHRCAPAKDPPRPQVVEAFERLADARAARPVDDKVGDFINGRIYIMMAQCGRQMGQARAESECLHVTHILVKRMDEVQEQARIAIHRPADVTDYDQRPGLCFAAAPGKVHDLAPISRIGPDYSPQIKIARPPAGTAQPACLPGAKSPTDPLHGPFNDLLFLFRELGEVFMAQEFQRAVQSAGLRVVFFRRLVVLFKTTRTAIFQAGGHEGIGRLSQLFLLLRLAKMVRLPEPQQPGVYAHPEKIKSLIKRLEIMGIGHQKSARSVIKIIAVRDVN